MEKAWRKSKVANCEENRKSAGGGGGK